MGGAWVADCGPNLGAAALGDFLGLWMRVADIHHNPEVEDKFVWRWTKDGSFSTRSAYTALFAGKMRAVVADEIWKSHALYNCKLLAWLIAKNRCWTAERLQ